MKKYADYLLIFAWNELGEGGYLVPVPIIGDLKATYRKVIKSVK